MMNHHHDVENDFKYQPKMKFFYQLSMKGQGGQEIKYRKCRGFNTEQSVNGAPILASSMIKIRKISIVNARNREIFDAMGKVE